MGGECNCNGTCDENCGQECDPGEEEKNKCDESRVELNQLSHVRHQERAEALFREGYNCAQSVLAAFSDEIGMDLETAMRLSSSFGGGMGRLREVCGAVSAMFMIAGLKYGYSNPQDSNAKAEHYRLIQELAQKFEKQNGSIICRELLKLQNPQCNPVPDERTQNYYQGRPCVELVKSATKIIEEYLEEKQS